MKIEGYVFSCLIVSFMASAAYGMHCDPNGGGDGQCLAGSDDQFLTQQIPNFPVVTSIVGDPELILGVSPSGRYAKKGGCPTIYTCGVSGGGAALTGFRHHDVSVSSAYQRWSRLRFVVNKASLQSSSASTTQFFSVEFGNGAGILQEEIVLTARIDSATQNLVIEANDAEPGGVSVSSTVIVQGDAAIRIGMEGKKGTYGITPVFYIIIDDRGDGVGGEVVFLATENLPPTEQLSAIGTGDIVDFGFNHYPTGINYGNLGTTWTNAGDDSIVPVLELSGLYLDIELPAVTFPALPPYD